MYDVADLVKQFFRELPEPLLTVRFSELLTSIQDGGSLSLSLSLCLASPDVV